MSESTYDVLARVLRDNEAESARESSGANYGQPMTTGYVNGLDASSARIRSAMVGLQRSDQPEWRGKPPEPLSTGPSGRIIDADYSVADESGHELPWTMPKNIPSP